MKNNQLEVIRQDMHRYIDAKIDQLIEMWPKEHDTFLEEINQPVKLESDEPEPTPDIPAPEALPEQVGEKLENKKVLVEKFGIEEISTIPDADWLRYAKTIMIAGWTAERLQASDSCKTVTFSKAESELLKNLECLRYTMLGKDMDLNQALGQNWVSELERTVIKEFVEKENLK